MATTIAMTNGCDEAPSATTPPAASPAASLPTSQPASAGTYLSDFIAAARVDWPKNRTLTIVCHGHSVPAGYFATPAVHSLDAYPNQIRIALANRFPHAVINVIVTAIGGENAWPGSERFERDVLSLKPDVVLIDYALNDRPAGLASAKEAWTKMIVAAKSRGVKVILLTPTPDTRSNWMDANDDLAKHAAQIRQLAAEHGVGLVDSYAAFKAAVEGGTKVETLMAQMNHPNHAGHTLVANEIVKWFDAAK